MFLDIVILPPAEVRRQVGRATAAVAKKYRLLMRVDNKKLIPHISLYHLLVQKKRLNALLSRLGHLLQGQRSVPITLGSVEAVAVGTRLYFGSKVRKSAPLNALHRRVLVNLLHYRAGSPLTERHKVLKQAHRILARKYGVFAVLSFFSPHITYGRIKNPQDARELVRLSNHYKLKSFVADTAAVTVVNQEHWQVTKILKTFKLRAP